jgi:hypothetical protein
MNYLMDELLNTTHRSGYGGEACETESLKDETLFLLGNSHQAAPVHAPGDRDQAHTQGPTPHSMAIC